MRYLLFAILLFTSSCAFMSKPFQDVTYKKNGFVVEGTFSQYAFRAGQYIDVFTMARLRQG